MVIYALIVKECDIFTPHQSSGRSDGPTSETRGYMFANTYNCYICVSYFSGNLLLFEDFPLRRILHSLALGACIRHGNRWSEAAAECSSPIFPPRETIYHWQ